MTSSSHHALNQLRARDMTMMVVHQMPVATYPLVSRTERHRASSPFSMTACDCWVNRSYGVRSGPSLRIWCARPRHPAISQPGCVASFNAAVSRVGVDLDTSPSDPGAFPLVSPLDRGVKGSEAERVPLDLETEAPAIETINVGTLGVERTDEKEVNPPARQDGSNSGKAADIAR